ncbi:MAG: flagellar biosynthesis protein FlhB [Clostridia bacterium]|nr:flagellar biosynthesis protein FlhB [Clostridia bacterium]
MVKYQIKKRVECVIIWLKRLLGFSSNPAENHFHSYKKVNLQLFAESEKTEKATPKRRGEAREKGQVLQSREITSAVVLLFLIIGIRIFGGYMYSEISQFMKRLLSEYPKNEELFTPSILYRLFMETLTVTLKTLAPVFLIALLTGLICSYAQVGYLFTMKTLGFKFSKLNPINGMKRMFSLHSLVELVKSIVKLVVVGFVAYSYLNGEKENVLNIMNMDTMGIGIYICTTAINVAIRICIAMLFIAVLDYIYQWWEFERNMKMTKQEVKEEFKQAEGNQEVKSKRKQRQREMSMRRVLQEVPKADVVITNPTHFAVAVKYDAKIADSPVVIAKGQDYIALRIKEVAKEHRVEIVENKPLARSLYETVEIGQQIPPELYQAVAEVLAFVYSLKGKGQAG